jgi:aryl-alcohol dehydrogenase (NADP+)
LKVEDLDEKSRVVAMARMRGRGKFDPQSELIQRKLELANALSGIAKEAGMSLTHMSMAFALEHPGVTSAIIGPRTQPQLEDLLACADLRLEPGVLDRIDALVPPGTNVNPIDMTSRPLGLGKGGRRRAGA